MGVVRALAMIMAEITVHLIVQTDANWPCMQGLQGGSTYRRGSLVADRQVLLDLVASWMQEPDGGAILVTGLRQLDRY